MARAVGLGKGLGRWISVAAVLLLLFVVTAEHGRAECAAQRELALIDRDWKFYRGDLPGAEKKVFADADWERVNIPHSFSIPYFLSSRFYSGYGWYRKQLHIPCHDTYSRYFLEFDGVFRTAEVYVNGVSVGKHSGGYTGFSIDITRAIVSGTNVLAVRVNNLWDARLSPRAGEHVFSGGIYRHVRLVRTSNLHVTWYGTFVTTPRLNAEQGTVHLNTEIRNESTKTASFLLKTTILDPRGEPITNVKTTLTIDAGSTKNFDQETASVYHPGLWSPSHPLMYLAITEVYKDGKRMDRYKTPFGFRWFRWAADKGFFLNGEHLYFHGANVHQDHAGWGDAVSDDSVARDVRMVKEAGMDFIRGSHYPHAPVFADECDRQGVLFWSENSFWGIGGQHTEGAWTASAYPPKTEDQRSFEDSVQTSLAEMIRINRNHPSIVAWSMGNEVFFSDSDLMPKVSAFLQRLIDEAHQLDPTRPAGIGGVQRGNLDHIGDIAGYNGDGARIFLNPGVPNFVSEYGSTIARRPGGYDPGFGDLKDQPNYPWRSGQVVWSGFDHGSIVPDLAHMGIIDYFRLPKRSWYWYRNEYVGIAPPELPAPGVANSLRLTADSKHIEHADGRGSVQLIVSVLDAGGHEISNTPVVRLEILSGPGELPTGRSITFDPHSDIEIRDGKAAIELRAYEKGEIHLRASSPGLQASDLTIQSYGGPLFVRGKTPVASERPYRESRTFKPTLGVRINAALNHPTKASSELPGHEGRFANDADPASYWQPVDDPMHGSWWQLEFENKVMVDLVEVEFQNGKDIRYEIDLSDDGKSWIPVATHLPGIEGNRTIVKGGQNGISLRIQFPTGQAEPVRVTDIRVFGKAVLD